MSAITFHVLGLPRPKGSAKAFRHRTTGRVVVMADNRGALKVWEQCVHVAALQARPRGGWCRWMGPVGVHVVFRLPRPKSAAKHSTPMVKPDLDKLVRGCMDPISGVLFNDDAQIVSISAGKSYCASGEQPGASITVRSMEPSS